MLDGFSFLFIMFFRSFDLFWKGSRTFEMYLLPMISKMSLGICLILVEKRLISDLIKLPELFQFNTYFLIC